MRLLSRLLIYFALVPATVAQAQVMTEIAYFDNSSGPSFGVVDVIDGYIYAEDGSDWVIYDPMDLSSPINILSKPDSGSIVAFWQVGSYVILHMGFPLSTGFFVYDVSDPVHPVFSNSLNFIYDVVVFDRMLQRVYDFNTTPWEGNLRTWDVSDPTQPVLLGNHTDLMNPNEEIEEVGTWVSGGHMVSHLRQWEPEGSSSGNYTHAWTSRDVRDPTQASYVSAPDAEDMILAAGSLWEWEGGQLLRYGFQSPTAGPVVLLAQHTSSTGSAAVVTYLETTDGIGRLVYPGDVIEEIDLTQSGSLPLLNTIPDPSLVLPGTFDWDTGVGAKRGFDPYLQTFLVSSELDPPNGFVETDITPIPTPNPQYPGGLLLHGDYLYALEIGGMDVYDVSTPATPGLVATHIPQITRSTHTHDVDATHRMVLAFDALQGYMLQDFTDPLAPIETFVDIGIADDGVADVDGNRLVFSFHNGTEVEVHLFDVTDPTQPVSLGDFVDRHGDIASAASDVELYGNLVYLIANDVLSIFDFTNLNNPRLETQVAVPYQTQQKELERWGGTLFVLRSPYSIWDLSADPLSPTQYVTPVGGGLNVVSHLEEFGEYVYGGSSTRTYVIDVTDPSNPVDLDVMYYDRSPVADPVTGVMFTLQDNYIHVWQRTSATGTGSIIPTSEVLMAPAPNPAGSGGVRFSWVRFERSAKATLQLYDVRGRRVREWTALDPAGGSLLWDGRDELGRKVASGVYYLVLTGSGLRDQRKIVRVK